MNKDQYPMGARPTTSTMLRWYPAPWRARYGDEFAAMIEDDLAGRRPTMRYRLSIARSGLNQQLRTVGLSGDSVPPSDRVRGGALSVLCAFALFVIPGVAFAKISEHWDESIQQGSRHVPAISYNLLIALAAACGVEVVLAAIALIPLFMEFVRTGGWLTIKRKVSWAVVATTGTGAVIGSLTIWAQHLTSDQRNTGFGWYQALFVIAAILFAATVFAWTAVAVAATRRLAFRIG